ncbi:MAG TPA: response regulator [Planctomycetaceae bacterium]|nr:response regulator [Planctomycetaceae bacterium]HIQ20381.1 response regulator [Planctomycetota bacterium]
MQDGKYVILCVDDDEDLLLCLQTVLEANGYLVATAKTGEEGLRRYKAVQPDLIILDLMMEEVDTGTSFVKELRALGNTAPIYMLSSVGDNLTMTTDYAALGLAGVLQKPIDNDQLLAILAARLKPTAAQR